MVFRKNRYPIEYPEVVKDAQASQESQVIDRDEGLFFGEDIAVDVDVWVEHDVGIEWQIYSICSLLAYNAYELMKVIGFPNINFFARRARSTRSKFIVCHTYGARLNMLIAVQPPIFANSR